MPKLMINGRTLEARAILFDKDGTLVDFHALWVNVTRAWIACLPEEFRLDTAEQQEIAAWLGVANDVDPHGPLVGRRDDQIALIAGFLYQRRRVPFSTALNHARKALVP
jgi:phosphoglycolate phosphatase-like HAD superfamily hydrolase